MGKFYVDFINCVHSNDLTLELGGQRCSTNVRHYKNKHHLSLAYITKDTSLYGYGIFLDEYMITSFSLARFVHIPF